MPRIRTGAFVLSTTLLTALVVAACSGSSDEDQPAAARQAIASSFQISSSEFSDIRPRKRIPNKNTCYGENASPPLTWSGAPQGTQSYALVSEDVDHATGIWVHWVLYDIPADLAELPEGVPTSTDVLPDGSIQGTNDDKNIGYNGPCPNRSVVTIFRTVQDSPHRSYFRLYALDTRLGLAPGATKDELLDAMDGHVLAQTETLGKYMPAPARRYTGRTIIATEVASTPEAGQEPASTPTP